MANKKNEEFPWCTWGNFKWV